MQEIKNKFLFVEQSHTCYLTPKQKCKSQLKFNFWHGPNKR
jgi:hypothetical protein